MTQPSSTPQVRMCSAILLADIQGMKTALEEGANPNLGPNGETSYQPFARALWRASELKDPDETQAMIQIMRMLLEAGAKANVNEQGNVGVHNLVRARHHFELFEMLLDHWPSSHRWQEHVLGDTGNTLLHLMADLGKRDMVELLVQRGMDVSAVDRSGNTPLHSAKDADTVATLLRLGSDPWHLNHRWRYPLIKAWNEDNTTPIKSGVLAGYLLAKVDFLSCPHWEKIEKAARRQSTCQTQDRLDIAVDQLVGFFDSYRRREALMAKQGMEDVKLPLSTRDSKMKM